MHGCVLSKGNSQLHLEAALVATFSSMPWIFLSAIAECMHITSLAFRSVNFTHLYKKYYIHIHIIYVYNLFGTAEGAVVQAAWVSLL